VVKYDKSWALRDQIVRQIKYVNIENMTLVIDITVSN
jgi:hypothetical protein